MKAVESSPPKKAGISFEATKLAWNAQFDCSSSERFVLLAYARFANTNFEAWPSNQTLHLLTSLNPKTIRKAIARLRELNILIAVVSNRGSSKRYLLNKQLLERLGSNSEIGTTTGIGKGPKIGSTNIPVKALPKMVQECSPKRLPEHTKENTKENTAVRISKKAIWKEFNSLKKDSSTAPFLNSEALYSTIKECGGWASVCRYRDGSPELKTLINSALDKLANGDIPMRTPPRPEPHDFERLDLNNNPEFMNLYRLSSKT